MMLDQDKVLHEKGPMKISPFTALNSFPDACTSQVAMHLGVQGPSFTISTACSSALDAIGVSFDLIRAGRIDTAITGGSEAPLCEPILAAFALVKALATRNESPQTASRPFDKERNGFVMGEGAGVLILEEYERAKKRGAQIYGEVLGHGMTCDAHHITAPRPDGREAIRALNLALSAARISVNDVDAINAHGTSTKAGDVAESKALQAVFGDDVNHVAISSTKSMTGHALGAAGALEAIFSILAIRDQVAPPTINLDNPDENCTLNYVPHTAQEMKIRHALSNSFGFGGTNGSILFSQIE